MAIDACICQSLVFKSLKPNASHISDAVRHPFYKFLLKNIKVNNLLPYLAY